MERKSSLPCAQNSLLDQLSLFHTPDNLLGYIRFHLFLLSPSSYLPQLVRLRLTRFALSSCLILLISSPKS